MIRDTNESVYLCYTNIILFKHIEIHMKCDHDNIIYTTSYLAIMLS